MGSMLVDVGVDPTQNGRVTAVLDFCYSVLHIGDFYRHLLVLHVVHMQYRGAT